MADASVFDGQLVFQKEKIHWSLPVFQSSRCGDMVRVH